ncbi:MAG: rhodanese-like domain-containing protein [Rhizobiales bacterium]|nr:rhodanese-like domain-containing protein [Hyphomicrobiales bacterium]
MSLKPVDVKTVQEWLAKGDCVLVDIREPNETAVERIAGAKLVPLSTILPADISDVTGKQVVYHCKGGMRTQQNADRLSNCAGVCDAFYLDGGIEAWKKAGLAVEH